MLTCWIAPSVLLGLMCWARADAALLAGLVGLGWLAAAGIRRDTLIALVKLSIFPVTAVLLQLAFRRVYYGEWVPNTALAKVAFTAHRLREGALYVRDAAFWLSPLALALAPALAAAVRSRRHRQAILLAAVPLAGWLAYVIVIGGDIFPARRHLVPALALAAFPVAEGCAWLWSRGLWTRFITVMGATAVVIAMMALGLQDPQNHRARHERWEWDGRAVGETLTQAFGPQRPLMAVDAGGCLPFFSRLPALDMLGLNDRYLAKHPPPDFGRGPLGHELGNGAYVLDRAPDIVIFGLPLGNPHALFRSGTEMQRDPRFARDYELITFETAPPERLSARMWIRRDGRIGIQRAKNEVRIPGWWLAASPGTIAQVDGAGRPVAVISSQSPARFGRILLEAGTWHAVADAKTSVALSVRTPLGELHPDAAGVPVVVTLSAPTQVEITLRPTTGDLAKVAAVVFRRVD